MFSSASVLRFRSGYVSVTVASSPELHTSAAAMVMLESVTRTVSRASFSA